MSKKQKLKSSKKAARRQVRAQVAKALKKGPSRRSPRSRPLPGMEEIRNGRLDNLCEAIGDERERMNAAKVEEQASIQAALQEMQRTSTTVYRHAGIELARVPGAEKIRVRVTKETGDADANNFKPPADELAQEAIDALADGL